MTIHELWQEGIARCEECCVPEAKLDARYLIEAVFHCDYSFIMTHGQDEVDEDKQTQYRLYIDKRCQRIPLQYILGSQEFMGYEFQVNEHVLIPRQDTEILVEAVCKHIVSKQDIQDVSLLDLCCGSGCIGISIYKQLEQKNKTCHLTSSDVSEEALQVTNINMKRLQVPGEVICSDLFAKLQGRYHCIVSNPPYIPSADVETLMPEVRDHEPRLALDGMEDGLFFYRSIIQQAERYLEDEGYVFFEIGFDQAEDIRQIFVENEYEDIHVLKDLAGLDRVVYAKKVSKNREV